MTVPVVISGPGGRMGQALVRLASADAELRMVGTLVSEKHAPDAVVRAAQTLSELDLPAGTVLVEFTTPEASAVRVREAAAAGIGMIIGTTGLSAKDQDLIATAAKKIPIIVAPNTSLGVTVLLDVVKRLSASLGTYDIEIVEMHHRMKADAPSGTALAFGRAAAEGRGQELEKVSRSGRDGAVGARPAAEIGIHAVRGGDVVGEHTITFAGIGERVEVIHRASSRDTFAAGALRAAKWISGKPAGMYSMRDVLGIG